MIRLTDMISLVSMSVVLVSLAYAGAVLPARPGELFYPDELPATPMNAEAAEADGPSMVSRPEPADEF